MQHYFLLYCFSLLPVTVGFSGGCGEKVHQQVVGGFTSRVFRD